MKLIWWAGGDERAAGNACGQWVTLAFCSLFRIGPPLVVKLVPGFFPTVASLPAALRTWAQGHQSNAFMARECGAQCKGPGVLREHHQWGVSTFFRWSHHNRLWSPSPVVTLLLLPKDKLEIKIMLNFLISSVIESLLLKHRITHCLVSCQF